MVDMETGEIISDPVELLYGEVFASLRDVVLQEVKAAGKSWQEMSQNEQELVIFRVDQSCKAIVGAAVRAMTAHEFPIVDGTIAQVTVKDGIKAVIDIPRSSANRFDLFDAVGDSVRVVIADPRDFMAAEGQETSDPDDPELPMGQEPGGGVAEKVMDAIDGTTWEKDGVTATIQRVKEG